MSRIDNEICGSRITIEETREAFEPTAEDRAEMAAAFDAMDCPEGWDRIEGGGEIEDRFSFDEYDEENLGDYPEDDEYGNDIDESMDGDHQSALASAGFGTDEDYHYDSYESERDFDMGDY